MAVVGSIKLASGKEANLEYPAGWYSDDELLAAHLNLFYDPNKIGLSVMPWGYMAIDMAAKDLNALAFHKSVLKPLPDDVVS